ncbi:putative zinc finger, CCHC-type containing protein, partial [Tanacetum coccineum]
ASFETFSTAIRASKPHLSFCDLLSQVKSHELFLTSLHGLTPTPLVSFVIDHSRPTYTSRGGSQSSHGGGRDCGHANLTHAFHAQCNLFDATPDWYVVDSRASAHMKSSPDSLLNVFPHNGNQTVTFVVPHLTKNLLYIRKLTSDNQVDVLFSQPYFTIQDRKTGQALARAKNPKWMQAMHDEMIALQQNGTWILVPRPSDTNVVGSKWVFRTKYHSDGSVDRFKA